MTNCWSEGALRAYLDRELPAGDMKSVAAHLGECSACDALCTELSARAARVFTLLEGLGEPETALRSMPMPPRAPSRPPLRWLWPGAAVALAAGLAIASFIVPKLQDRQATRDPLRYVLCGLPRANTSRSKISPTVSSSRPRSETAASTCDKSPCLAWRSLASAMRAMRTAPKLPEAPLMA